MKLKKILSIFLALTLMLGLFCANLSVTAEGKVWGDFEPQLMTSYTSYGGAFGEWSASDETGISSGYLLVANLIMRAHTNGYAAIRRFDSDIDGTFYLEQNASTPVIQVTNGSAGDSVKFGIFNQDFELIWPTNGDWYTAAYGEDYSGYIEVPVTAGGSLYFVVTDPTSAALSLNLYGIGHISSAPKETLGYYGKQIHSSGYLCGSDMSTQGVAGTHDVGKWYYMYAPSVELTTADPDGYTDEGGDEYTVDYGETLTPMTKISSANGDSNTGWLGNGDYRKTTFVSGYNAYFQAGHSLVVRYTPSGDGDLKIGYAGMQLKSTWLEGEGVDFYIVDHTGKVIYPEPGATTSLRAGTGNPFDKSKAAAFYKSNLNAGEWLDFVFIPQMATVADYTHSFYLAGGFTHPSSTASGNRVDTSGRLFLGNGESQGSRNIQMFTTTDISVNKVVTGEWKEFVQLESTLSAAPATAEAWVNIPAEVPDWKTGTLISDMTGTNGIGFAVMMDTFGHPRVVSGNVDWTVESVDLRTGAWQHIAFTVDTANALATFYQNGVAVATTALTEAAPAVSGKAAVIGNDLSYASTTAFQGAVKKLALFSDVRTAEEIAADSAAVSTSAEGLIGYWVLNGVYTDKSTSANDGTLTAVNEDWYENGTPADAADGEYTIVHIGDNQVVTDFYNDGYQEITQWIADNAERLNIQMVVNSGDLVNYAATTSQWVDAKAGMDILKAAGIPYVYALGNHEYPASGGEARTTTEFNNYFAIEDHLTQGAGQTNETTLLYAYPRTEKITAETDLMPNTTEGNTSGVTSYDTVTEGLNENAYVETMENAVYTAVLGGKQYIIVALEAQPRTAVVEWANTVLTALETEYAAAGTAVTTIVVEHYYIGSYGQIGTGYDMFNAAERLLDVTPTQLWDQFISQHASIQLVLSGHVATGIATRTDIGTNGNKVVSIMNDQSYEGNGGEGNILLLRCKADGTVIKAEYYSPILERYYQQAYQFDFDTAADSDLVMDMSSLTQMGYYVSASKAWFVSSSHQAASHPYMTETANSVAGDYAVARAYQAGHSGTLSFSLAVLTTTDKIEMMVCKEDGTVLWPSSGTWTTPAASSARTITCDVEAGEKVFVIVRRVDPSITSRSTTYTEIRSGTIMVDGETVESFSMGYSTSHINSTQGNGGWYTYYGLASQLNLVPIPHTVTYAVDGEGGTLGASTSGTWADGVCTVPAGGTVRFVAKPDVGYRIVGYYVNGEYHKHTRRVLTLPMIKEDTDVKVVFEWIKIAGDANADGVVDILDLVNMNSAAIVDKTVSDLADNDAIDTDDVKALRNKLLGY